MDAEKGVATAEDALTGARYIISEMISENADHRKVIRQMMMDSGFIIAKAIEGVEDPEGKYKMYVSYAEPAAKIPSHRMLAIRRGAKEGVLTFEIELERQQPLAWLRSHVVRRPGDWVPHLFVYYTTNGSNPEGAARRPLTWSAQ